MSDPSNDGDLSVQFRIHGRRRDINDRVERDMLLDKGLSHRDVEVMKNGRFVMATEEELKQLQELGEKIPRDIWIKEAEEENARKAKREKNPPTEAEIRREHANEILDWRRAGSRVSYPVGQFTIKFELPMDWRRRTNSLTDYLRECAARFPHMKCKLVRKGSKTVTRTLAVSELLPDDDYSPVDQPFLESVFNYLLENPSRAPRRQRRGHTRSIRSSNEQTWNLVLRIETPTERRPSWWCELCGRRGDDASVVVGLNDESAKSLNQSQRDKLRSTIYSTLEDVTEYWEPLCRITAPASGVEVDSEEVVALISKAINQLESLGVRVQLPRELVRSVKQRLQKKCHVSDELPRKPGVLTRDIVLRFQISLEMDGEPLSPEELQALAEIREPLVRIRGKWVYVDSELKDELQKIANRVLKTPVQSLPAEKALGEIMTCELREASGADEIRTQFKLEANGLPALMESLRSKSPAAVLKPSGLDATLRHYQEFGFQWLTMLGNYGLGACLADDMGLGKTVQTLAWLAYLKESGIMETSLLICPTSVMSNWEKEAEKFTPGLRVYRHHGTKRSRNDLDFFKAVRSKDLVITSYTLLHRDQEMFQNVSWKWSAVILDEAQNIKNQDTAQSKAARELSSRAASRLALTGTPIENGPRDLWPIMEFLNPGMLGTWPQFVKNCASPIEQDDGANHLEELREKISPFILRRKKTDPDIAPELPPKIEQTVWCSLSREQSGWYKAVLNNAESRLRSTDQKERQGAILRVLQELKQVCNGVAVLQKDRSEIDTRAGKIEQLAEMLISVVSNGEKALIFSQYPSQFEKLDDALTEKLDSAGCKIGILTLTGEDSIGKREETQATFASDARFPVVLISLRAGGTGLNMQSASHVFHLDRWWNAAVEDQATDRTWRIGQERTVHVHKFVCRGTLEERIDELISRKRQLAQDLLGEANEQSVIEELNSLDGTALLEILRLNEDEAINEDF